jgi:NarL family two-component system response regulator LiaR
MRATSSLKAQHLLVSENQGHTHFSEHDTSITTSRILLAEDQERVVQVVLHSLPNCFKVVGIAKNGIHALDLARKLLPDVVILNICMPRLNGIETARRLKEFDLYPKVVFLSGYADRDFVEAAFSAGALAYVLKPCLATDLIPAIQAALEGNTFVSRLIQLR